MTKLVSFCAALALSCGDDEGSDPVASCSPTEVTATPVAPGVAYYDCTQTTTKAHVVVIDRNVPGKRYEMRLVDSPNPGGSASGEDLVKLETVETLARDNDAIVAINGNLWEGEDGYPQTPHLGDELGVPLTTVYQGGVRKTPNTSTCHVADRNGHCPEAWMGFAENTTGSLEVLRFPYTDDRADEPPPQYRHALYGSNSSVLMSEASDPCPQDDEKDYWSVVGYGPDKIVLLTTAAEYRQQDLCAPLQAFGATDAVRQDGSGSAQLFVDGLGWFDPAGDERRVAYALALVDLAPATTPDAGPGDGGGGDGGSGGGGDGGGGGGGDGGGCAVDSTCGGGTSWGDPHLVTFDGVAYDFQAVGEFVALESTAGAALVVQVRQGPLGTSRQIAVNTAVAARLGDDRVALYAGRSQPLVVNGEARALADGATLDLAGGGRVLLRGNRYTLIPPADAAERVQVGMAADHLDIHFALPRSRQGQVRGLFGDFDGDLSDDVATRTGMVLRSPTFQEFYASFAESWRIAQEESLFDYAASESSETFTDRTFPDRFVSARDLPDGEHAAARQICVDRGITDSILLEWCILDVALSGDPNYASGAAATAPPSASFDMLVNIAAGKPVTAAGAITGDPQLVTNRIFAPEGQYWEDLNYAVVTPAGTSLMVDLGAVHSLAQVVVQADNNDSYVVESSVDGVTWSTLANVPTYGGAGLQTRPVFDLPGRVQARYARIQATAGDGAYSVSELELYAPALPSSP